MRRIFGLTAVVLGGSWLAGAALAQQELVDLGSMEQELARPLGLVVVAIAAFERGDVGRHQPVLTLTVAKRRPLQQLRLVRRRERPDRTGMPHQIAFRQELDAEGADSFRRPVEGRQVAQPAWPIRQDIGAEQ